MEGDGRGDGRGGGSGIETGGPRVIFARAILIVIPRFYSAHLGVCRRHVDWCERENDWDRAAVAASRVLVNVGASV